MKYKKGTSGNLAGRPKTKSLGVKELISKDSVRAYKLLSKAMMASEPWAMDIFFRELMPKDTGLSKD